MGKCKKRTLNGKNSSFFMTRESAVNDIFRIFEEKRNKKNASNYKKAVETISLFGISAEELSEAGVSYENLRALNSIII